MSRFPIGALLVLHTSLALSLTAQEVYVTAGEVGQGALRARLAECFVITPFHVVEKALGPIEIVGAARVKRTGELQTRFEPDFAIIRLEKGDGLECEQWLPPTNYDAMLKTQSAGYLSIREADGSRTRMPVTFRNITENEIVVRPTQPSDQIQKSMSGASLLVNGALVGMLLQRTDDGDGLVYQLDDIMRISEPYFKVVTSASIEAARSANAFADRFESWFACFASVCMLQGVSAYADRVREIRIGEFPNQWERVITPKRSSDPAARAVDAVPIRPGAKTIHAQLTFADGTASEVRRIAVSESDVMTGTRLSNGTRLSASGARAAQAPIVYAGVAVGGGSTTILPLAPTGTVVVRYAFDAGGFFDAQPMQQMPDVFAIPAPPGAPGVRLAFVLADGTEVGPFEYSLGKVADLTDESLLAALTASLPGSIACTRIPFKMGGPPPTGPDTSSLASRQQQRQTAMDIRSDLMRAGLSAEMVGEAPITICTPWRMGPALPPGASRADYWGAAKEIRFGTSPGQLTTRVAITGTKDTGAGGWYARLPATATAIYVQVEFRNGKSSREFRLPIADIADVVKR